MECEAHLNVLPLDEHIRSSPFTIHVVESSHIVYGIYDIYNSRNRHRNDKRIETPRNDNVNFSTATSFPMGSH